jgi:hypothetical protein
VALADPPVADRGLDGGCKLQKAQRVRHGRTGTSDASGDRVLAEAELVDQASEAACGLDGVKVFALEVLDQGHLELGPVVELAHDRRDPLETGRRGRS